MTFTTAILSGGKSSRMGTDKGSLKINQKTFVDDMIVRMKGSEEILLSVGMTDVYDNDSVRHISDEFVNCGPMGGIHKVLKETKSDWNFVVACDMPYMHYAFAEQLLQRGLSQNPECDMIYAVDVSGKQHMLGAFYHRRLLHSVEKRLKEGTFRLRDLIQESCSAEVILTEEESRNYLNVNTQDEYKAFRRDRMKIVQFAGYSNTGKTTLIEKVIAELTGRGIRCGYLKHTHHDIDPAPAGKDNARMFTAGAAISITASENGIQVLERKKTEINDLLSRMDGTDLLIIEGYKKEDFGRLLVVSTPDESQWPLKRSEVLKVIGNEENEAYDFSRDQIREITDYIIRLRELKTER